MDASLSRKNIKKCIWELKKRKKVSFSAARVISFHQGIFACRVEQRATVSGRRCLFSLKSSKQEDYDGRNQSV